MVNQVAVCFQKRTMLQQDLQLQFGQ